jgi:hypothetical protein
MNKESFTNTAITSERWNSERRIRDRSRSRERDRYSRRDRSRSRERYPSRRDRSRSRERDIHSYRSNRSRSLERDRQNEIEKLNLDIEIAKKKKELADIQSSYENPTSSLDIYGLLKSAVNSGKNETSLLPIPLPPPPPPPTQFLFSQPISDTRTDRKIHVVKSNNSYHSFLDKINKIFEKEDFINGCKLPREIWPLKPDGTMYSTLKNLADDYNLKYKYINTCFYLLKNENIQITSQPNNRCNNKDKCYNMNCKFRHPEGYIPRPIYRCMRGSECRKEVGSCHYSHPTDKYWASLC